MRFKRMYIKFITASCVLCSFIIPVFSQQKSAFNSGKQTISLDDLDNANSIIRKGDAAYGEQKYSEAAELYLQAAVLPVAAYFKDSIYYNAACSYAKAGNLNEAFEQLGKSVASGYRKPYVLETDSDLISLRTDLRWRKVLAKARRNESEYRSQHSDPLKAHLITSDIETYVRAFDLAAKETTDEGKVKIFKTEYLEHGTPGLLDFYSRRKIGGIDLIVKAVNAMPRYYGSIRTLPQRLDTVEKNIRKGFIHFKEMYPDAIYPDIYFVIGHIRSGGTISDRGLLIGAEVFNVSPGTPIDEIKVNPQYYHPLAEIPQVVAHELVHFQQKLDGKNTLLEKVLIEGGADFMADLSVPGLPVPDYRVWGEAHEKLVWERFQKEMNGTDVSNWIANNDKATPEWAAVQGYYIGYKIAKAYYDQAKDKKAAIRDLINLKDAKAILQASKYNEKFVQ